MDQQRDRDREKERFVSENAIDQHSVREEVKGRKVIGEL